MKNLRRRKIHIIRIHIFYFLSFNHNLFYCKNEILIYFYYYYLYITTKQLCVKYIPQNCNFFFRNTQKLLNFLINVSFFEFQIHFLTFVYLIISLIVMCPLSKSFLVSSLMLLLISSSAVTMHTGST